MHRNTGIGLAGSGQFVVTNQAQQQNLAAPNAPRESILSAAVGELDRIMESAAHVLNRFTAVSDRVLGSFPGNECSEPRTEPGSAAEALQQRIGTLSRIVALLHDQATRLEVLKLSEILRTRPAADQR